MPPGIQEIIALVIVFAVVAFALYRRRRAGAKKSACGDACGQSAKPDEATVHFYRRNKD
jgi:hypothetical protein